MRLTLLHAAVLALVLVAGCSTAPESPPTAARPNIIFVFSDDHAAHAISAYGSRINKTPNIDRLAREGMLFRNCFVTNSICAPSRAVILTGKHSHLNGQITNGQIFDGAQQTFPKLLRAAGYQTALVGKWHLRSDPTGFDYWDILIGQGPYYNPPMKSTGGTRVRNGYTTDVITDHALQWLKKKRDRTKPFMLMFQHKAPHRPWQPSPKHLTMYDDVTIPEPANLFDDWKGRTTAAGRQEMTIARHMFEAYDLKVQNPAKQNRYRSLKRMTKEQRQAWDKAYGPKNAAFLEARLEGRERVRWKYQRYVKDYLRTIASLDDNLGRVLDYLDKSGLADNTIVIYSSDQGFFLGDHGWYDKRWFYEESARMPFLVRWPGVTRPGSENKDLVQNLDFAETFLDAAGVKVPADMQGRSLVPLLRGNTPADWRTAAYYHYWEYPAVHAVRRHYGIRSKTHKLIHYYTINEWELFDLVRDPDERKNVHADPAYADVVRTMTAELRRQQKQFGDTEPLKTKPLPKDRQRRIAKLPDEGPVVRSFFSRDGLRAACAVRRDGKSVVHVGKREAGTVDEVVQFAFGAKEKHWAYVGRVDGRFVVRSDQEQYGPFDEIGRLRFTDREDSLTFRCRSGPQWMVVEGTVRSAGFDLVAPPVTDAATHRFLWPARRDGRWCVMDGREEGPFFDEVKHVTVSAEGGTAAYAAREGDRWRLVRNGKPNDAAYDAIEHVTACRDGRRLSYVARRGEEWFVVTDDKTTGPYAWASHAAFSRNGKRCGHQVKRGERYGIVVDGTEIVGNLPIAANPPSFSPDGRRVGYDAHESTTTGMRSFAVIDGKRGDAFDKVFPPRFSADSRRVAYKARTGDRWSVVVDGVGQVSESEPRFFFAPAGSKIAIEVGRKGKRHVLVNGKPGPPHDAIGQVVLSHDGLDVAYQARDGDRWCVVVNGRPGPPAAEVGRPSFPGGARVRYAARVGRRLVRRIAFIP